MKIYLKNYVDLMEEEVREKKKFSKDDIEELKVKIGFFQHERLIHSM